MIAPYISEDEYACHHCGRFPPDLHIWPDSFQSLFRAFAALRESWGHPIVITSGYRCEEREKQVSGVTYGPHTYGLALDLGIPAADQPRFMETVNRIMPGLRVGTNTKVGQTHIHIDVCFLVVPRPTNNYARGVRWTE